MRSAILFTIVSLMLWSRPASGDELRNVKVGQDVPPFALTTLSGSELRSTDLRGKVSVLVYVAAEQRSSEIAAQQASAVVRELRNKDVALAFVTADVTRPGVFRTQRTRLDIHEPLGLDVARQVYGALGLIVLPTTMVIDREGRLAHVIASARSDYDHMLRVYIEHALGTIDDAEMQERLTRRQFERNRPSDRVARRRAAARLLRQNGLVRDAENELCAALEIDPQDADVQLDLASLYIESERFDEADALVASVIGRAPGHRRGKLLQGMLLYHQGRLDQAEAVLRQVLLLNPDPIRTHYYLGLISEQRGEKSAAIGHFKEALTRLLEHHPM